MSQKCNCTISKEIHVSFIYSIKNMRNVKYNSLSNNTKQKFLVCRLFLVLLKLEL